MEETVLPQTQDGAGFEPASLRQFTIFLENRVGKLQSLMLALEEGKGKVAAISVEESGDATLVRLVCTEPDESRATLQEKSFSFCECDVLAVELPRRQSAPLVSVCAALLTAEINIHYLYPMLLRPRGPALVLYVDDRTLATQLLIRKGFVLIGESDLKA